MKHDKILKLIKNELDNVFDIKIPLYLRVSDAIEKAIQQSDIKENEPLPSERELATMLDVSRITIRKSIENLEQKEIVNRIHGRGTFIKKRIAHNLQGLSGFTEEFGMKNVHLKQKWLMRKRAPATEEEAKALCIAHQSPVCHLKRIRYINHMPLALEHAVISAKIMEDPYKVQHSLYQYFKEIGHTPQRAFQKVTAKNCIAAEADLLQIPPHNAVLYIERRSFDAYDTTIEFVRSLYRSDLYELMVELHIAKSD